MGLLFLFLHVCWVSLVMAKVILVPPGDTLSVCPGRQGSVQCTTTERPSSWRIGSQSRLINSVQPPEMIGNLTLTVISVVSNGTNFRVTSTVTIGYSQLSGSLLVECREATTNNRESVTFIPADPPFAPTVNSIVPLATQSGTNTTLLLSWSMSDCAVQYVVTIINSSDGSVYLNITTSDTNTTVTLPTGVEYCVTVLGVDSINRSGQPSQQQCYNNIVTSVFVPSPSSSTAASPSPTPSVDPPPSGVSGGVIAGAVIVAVIVIILAVIAAATVIVIISYRNRRHQKVTIQDPLPMGPISYKFACQTFYKWTSINFWTVAYVFVPQGIILQEFKDYTRYRHHDLEALGKIEFTISKKTDGWKVTYTEEPKQISKDDIYADVKSDDKRPHIEMTITAASDMITPPDLTVEAKLKGVNEPNIINFEIEAQNVVDCSCKVFYIKEDPHVVNCWRAIFTFFPLGYEKNVDQHFQHANNLAAPFDVKFGGGNIKMSPDNQTAKGWKVDVVKDRQEVTTAAVEQYTGEGEPPYCEMTLRATNSDKSDLIIPVTLIGVRQPNNTFNIERALEDPDGIILCTPEPTDETSVPSKGTHYLCQVFYHKLGTNHWKATLAFFPNHKLTRVHWIYQDANYSPAMEFLLTSSGKIKLSKLSPKTCAEIAKNDEIVKEKVNDYDGVDKPPHFEIILKPIAKTCVDQEQFTVTVKLDGVAKNCNKVSIMRMVETLPEDATELETKASPRPADVNRIASTELGAVGSTNGIQGNATRDASNSSAGPKPNATNSPETSHTHNFPKTASRISKVISQKDETTSYNEMLDPVDEK